MAEQVQAAMDQMVEPLRDLLDRNIFTSKEIQSIVNRRRESEYLLRRPSARKADFLRYIEAEQLLEKLRKVRVIQRKREEKDDEEKLTEDDDDNNKTQKKKNHIGDVHIIQHIHLLFTRAIRKFRSDLSLHLLYADFVKSQTSSQKLGKIYAEALQIFPRQVGLWIEAASHEYFGPTRSIRGSRILFQRAIRINSSSEELWLEYFTLELHYAQALMGRKQILLSPSPVEEAQQNSNTTDDNDDKNTDSNTTDDYKIAAIVLKKALKEVSNNLQFRLRVLDTCQRFPNTDQFVQMIQVSLQQDYSNTPESWIARAMHYATTTGCDGDDDNDGLDFNNKQKRQQTTITRMEERAKEVEESSSSSSDDDSDDDRSEDQQEKDKNLTKNKKARRIVDPVVSVLEDAIDTLRTGDMYVQALRFVRSYHNGLLDGDSDQQGDDDYAEENQQQQQRLQETERFLKHLVQVPAHKLLSSDLALEESDYFESLGRRKDAIRVLKEYCTANDTTPSTSKSTAALAPAALWIQWASLVDDEKNKKSILQQGLVRVPMNNANYQPLLLQFFGVQLSLLSQTKSTGNKHNDGDDDDDDVDKSDEDSNNSEARLMDTFQKILLLAPAREIVNKGNEDSMLGGDTGVDEASWLKSTEHACLKYLEHGYKAGGIRMARRIYSIVLFQSSLFDKNDNHDNCVNAEHLHHCRDFVDKCLEIETSAKRRRQIFDKVIEIFQGSPLEGSYKKRKRDTVIYQ